MVGCNQKSHSQPEHGIASLRTASQANPRLKIFTSASVCRTWRSETALGKMELEAHETRRTGALKLPIPKTSMEDVQLGRTVREVSLLSRFTETWTMLPGSSETSRSNWSSAAPSLFSTSTLGGIRRLKWRKLRKTILSALVAVLIVAIIVRVDSVYTSARRIRARMHCSLARTR